MRDAGIQREWLSKFHGVTFKGSIWGKLLENVSLRDLRFGDIAKFIQGAIFSLSCLEEEQMKVDIPNEIPELKVPVYFCIGRRDYNVPFELVVDYFEKLIALRKHIVWFEQSAHLPNFEEPNKFCDFCSRIKSEIFSSEVAA